jgi:hypothetical protein
MIHNIPRTRIPFNAGKLPSDLTDMENIDLALRGIENAYSTDRQRAEIFLKNKKLACKKHN